MLIYIVNVIGNKQSTVALVILAEMPFQNKEADCIGIDTPLKTNEDARKMKMDDKNISGKKVFFSIGKTRMVIRLVAVVAMLFNASALTATTLSSLSLKEYKNKTTVYCKLSELPRYRSFILQSPLRVVVDFQNTITMNKLLQKNFSNQMIKKVRIGHPSPNTTRIVFDLRKEGQVNAFWAKTRQNHSGVLHINILSKKNATQFVKNQANKHNIVHNQPHLVAFAHPSNRAIPYEARNFVPNQRSFSTPASQFGILGRSGGQARLVQPKIANNTQNHLDRPSKDVAIVDVGRDCKVRGVTKRIVPNYESHPWIINGGIGYTWYDAGYSNRSLPPTVSENKIGDGKTVFGRFAIGRDLLTLHPIRIGLELGVQSGNIERLDTPQNTLDLMGGMPIQLNIKPMVDLLLTGTTEPLESMPAYGVLKLGVAYRRMQINDRITVNDLSQANFELQVGLGRKISDRLNLALLYQGILSGNTKFAVNADDQIGHISNIPAQNGLLLNLMYRL